MSRSTPSETLASAQIFSTLSVECQRHQEINSLFTPGERVSATEKIHGSATCVTWVRPTREIWVSSKGFAARRLAIRESETNLY